MHKTMRLGAGITLLAAMVWLFLDSIPQEPAPKQAPEQQAARQARPPTVSTPAAAPSPNDTDTPVVIESLVADLTQVADVLGMETSTCTLSPAIVDKLGPNAFFSPSTHAGYVLGAKAMRTASNQITFVTDPDLDELNLKVLGSEGVRELAAFRLGPGVFECSEPGAEVNVRLRLNGDDETCALVEGAMLAFETRTQWDDIRCGDERTASLMTNREPAELLTRETSRLSVLLTQPEDHEGARPQIWLPLADICTLDDQGATVLLDCHASIDASMNDRPMEGFLADMGQQLSQGAALMHGAPPSGPDGLCGDAPCELDELLVHIDDLTAHLEAAHLPEEAAAWGDRRTRIAMELVWPSPPMWSFGHDMQRFVLEMDGMDIETVPQEFLDAMVEFENLKKEFSELEPLQKELRMKPLVTDEEVAVMKTF